MVAVSTYEPEAPAPTPLDRPPEERGVTDIRSDAVAHIAERVAQEVPGVHGVAEHGLTSIVSEDKRSVGTTAEVLPDRSVRLTVTVGVDYPSPVRATVNALRAQLIERVETLTGYRVARLDIDIAELSRTKPRRRVL